MFTFVKNAVAAGSLAIALLASSAHATLIDFEDIPTPGCCTFLPLNYHGLNFLGSANSQSWVIGDDSVNVFSGTTAHSGDNFAWSNGTADLSIENSLFDLNSLWARSGQWLNYTVVARGYRGLTEVYTQTVNITEDYQLFSFNFLGIDKFVIGGELTNLLVDDITINQTSVPEPAPVMLVALGLFGIWFKRRRNV